MFIWALARLSFASSSARMAPSTLPPKSPPKYCKILNTTPYELSLRCEVGSNVPQIQFNDDGTWHDFAPVAMKQGSLKLGHRCQAGAGLARAGLVPGAWYPYLMLNQSARLSDHVVEHLEPE